MLSVKWSKKTPSILVFLWGGGCWRWSYLVIRGQNGHTFAFFSLGYILLGLKDGD